MFGRPKIVLKGKLLTGETYEIRKATDEYIVNINGEFYCTTQSISEAQNELDGLGKWLARKSTNFMKLARL